MPRSRRCWNARVRSSACRESSRCSRTRRRENLLEGADRDALVHAAFLERVGGYQRFGFLARRAVDHDQRAGARAFRGALERAAEHDASGMGVEEFDVRCAMRVAQLGRIGAVETDDRVHGKLTFFENKLWPTRTTSEKARISVWESRRRTTPSTSRGPARSTGACRTAWRVSSIRPPAAR